MLAYCMLLFPFTPAKRWADPDHTAVRMRTWTFTCRSLGGIKSLQRLQLYGVRVGPEVMDAAAKMFPRLAHFEAHR